MTSAAKAKRRPPFTTLATRLMCTSLSGNSLSRSSRPPRSRSRRPSRRGSCAIFETDPLEVEAAFTRGIGQRLDASVIEIAAAVEHDVLDSLFLRALGDQLADS